MHKTVIFLFFCMIFVVKTGIAQNSYERFLFRPRAKTTSSNFHLSLKPFAAKGFKGQFNIATAHKLSHSNVFLPANSGVFCVIPADFYTRSFGFFCKKEQQFEKKSKISLKIRLGSVRYVDHLEGKPNSGILPGQ